MADQYTHGSLFSRSKPNFLKNGNLKDCLQVDAETDAYTGTKVVSTIGPACQDVEQLAGMLKAGMVGARIDLTWGSLDFHRASLQNLNTAMQQTRKLCCSMVDTQGRELMIRRQIDDVEGWDVHEAPFAIKAGQTVTITPRKDVVISDNIELIVSYERFHEMTEEGDTIYIGRYLVCGAESASLYLEVKDVQGTDVICVAKNDAVLEGLLTAYHVERSSSSLSNALNDLALLSERDKSCLESLSKEFDLDFVCVSYTRDAQDIKDVRAYLDSIGMDETKIIAKIATRQSLLTCQGILNQADGIIMSRGTLGLDCLPEKMALVQKTLIKACNLVGKPVLLTRVVDTMINTPRPTRAEATDVANAVLDGVDGFVLGAETFRGKYPELTVRTISKISRSAEKVFDHQYHYEHLMEVAVDVVGHQVQEKRKAIRAADDSGSEEIFDAKSSSADMLAMPPAKRHVGFADDTSDGLSENGSGQVPAAPTRPKELHKVASVGEGMKLESAAAAIAHFGMGSVVGLSNLAAPPPKQWPVASKLEALSSSAVRTADKVQASLIVVYTHTGETAQLVAKYRPQMPILTLVVPHLVSHTNHWKLEGKSIARQCLLTRGLLPMMSAPGHNEDKMLEDAVRVAARMGMVKAHDHVVCMQRVQSECCVKVLSVDALGHGIQRMSRSNSATLQHAQLPGAIPGFKSPRSSGATGGFTLTSTLSMVDTGDMRYMLDDIIAAEDNDSRRALISTMSMLPCEN